MEMFKNRNAFIYFCMSILLLSVGVYGWYLNGIHDLLSWIGGFSLGINFLLLSFVVTGDKEDEREKLVKYKSLMVPFVATIVFVVFLLFTHNTWLKNLTTDDLLSSVFGVVVISQGIGRFVYSKIM